MRKQLSIMSLSSIFLGRPCGNVMMACLPSSARRMSLIILTATQDAETYEGTSEPDNSSRWINAMHFYAILHGLGAGMFPSLCSWTMRDAFEQTPLTDHAALDCHLSAAAQWIIYAGQAIFHVILVPKENEFTHLEGIRYGISILGIAGRLAFCRALGMPPCNNGAGLCRQEPQVSWMHLRATWQTAEGFFVPPPTPTPSLAPSVFRDCV